MSTAIRSKIRKHPASDLRIDRRVQRDIVPLHLRWLSRNLDFAAIGVITVSERSDGGLYIIDGQHRWAALIENGHENYALKCEVRTGLTLAEEARAFRALNSAKAVRPLDKYRAGVVAGEPDHVGVDRILTERGLVAGAGSNAVQAVAALLRSYNLGDTPGDALELALGTIKATWGDDPNNFEGAIIEGFAIFFANYPAIDLASLTARLAKLPRPERVIAEAYVFQKMFHGRLAKSCARYLVWLYNHGRRQANHLPQL